MICVQLNMPLSCRFYEHKFPEVEDVVMVNVRSIAEMGAYVHLLEYNNIEGMILLSELSRRRIRSINKLIRIGRDECVVVIRVDKDKGKHYRCIMVLLKILITAKSKSSLLSSLFLIFFLCFVVLLTSIFNYGPLTRTDGLLAFVEVEYSTSFPV